LVLSQRATNDQAPSPMAHPAIAESGGVPPDAGRPSPEVITALGAPPVQAALIA